VRQTGRQTDGRTSSQQCLIAGTYRWRGPNEAHATVTALAAGGTRPSSVSSDLCPNSVATVTQFVLHVARTRFVNYSTPST